MLELKRNLDKNLNLVLFFNLSYRSQKMRKMLNPLYK